MPHTAHQTLPKIKATMAAADPNCTAVALTEFPAEVVSFRWHQPSLPPHKNVNSAVAPLFAAGQFSGKYANYAAFCA
jgi:hypothetical protein